MRYRCSKSLSFAFLMLTVPLEAEVIFDGTFGHTDVRSGDFLIDESDGQLSSSGNNLFHSFDTFNVLEGETATFTFTTGSIETIIGRVTGTGATIIDGTIASDANLWIANPNGVLIGFTAVFDGSGIIQVEAADTISFSNGDTFRIRETNLSSLSVSSPDSFGFISARLDGSFGSAADVLTAEDSVVLLTEADGEVAGRNAFFGFDRFSIYPEQALGFDLTDVDSLVISTNGTENSMINGQLSVFGDVDLWFLNPNGILVGSGSFFDLTSDLHLGTASGLFQEDDTFWELGESSFSLAPAAFGVDGTEGTMKFDGAAILASGNVELVGGQLVEITNGSLIDASTFDDESIAVSILAEDISITDGASISSDSLGESDAGGVRVDALNSIEVRDSSLFSDSLSSGSAGLVELFSGGSIVAQNAFITSEAFDSGDSGFVDLFANEITLNDSFVTTSGSELGGSAGVVTISASGVALDGATVFSDTYADDPEFVGSVGIFGDTLIIENSFITSETFSSGDAGFIDLLGSLVIVDDSFLTSSGSSAGGSAGVVSIDGGDVFLTGVTVFSDTFADEPNFVGSVGISADNLLSVDASSITSETFSAGDAGFVDLIGNSVTVTDSLLTSSGSFAGGSAGSVSISGVDVTVSGSTVFSDTFADEPSFTGSVSVLATDQLTIDQGSFVATETFSGGDAGGISISGSDVLIDSSNIASSSVADFTSRDLLGSAGFVDVTGVNVTVADSEIKTDAASSRSLFEFGNVFLQADGGLLTLVGSEISSSSDAASEAGIVTLLGDSIIVDNSRVVTATSNPDGLPEIGGAGVILIDAVGSIGVTNDSLISSDNASTAAGAFTGVVEVTAGDSLDITNSAITSNTSDAAPAGDIFLNADEIFISRSEVFVENEPDAPGDAGDINISGGDLTLDVFAAIASRTFSSGSGGNVTVDMTGDVLVAGTSRMTSTSLDQGSAGFVSVNGDTITIDASEVSSDADFILLADAILAVEFAAEELGIPLVLTATTVDEFIVEIQPILEAISGQSFDAENVNQLQRQLKALPLTELELLAASFPGISIIQLDDIVAEIPISGPAGDVQLQARTIGLESGVVSTTANSDDPDARPGNVSVIASEQISLSDFSVIQADTNLDSAAGNVSLSAPTISMNASQISADTFGQGDAGNISLVGDSVLIGEGSLVFTQTLALEGGGDAGIVAITAGDLSIDSSEILSDSFSPEGNGGNIFLDVENQFLLTNADVESGAFGSGDAGNISIVAGQVLVNNGLISSGSSGFESVVGSAGSITFDATSIELVDSLVNTESAATSEDALPAFILLNGTDQVSVVSSILNSDTIGAARAGDVLVTGGDVNLTSATIFAESFLDATGDAGNIFIDGNIVTLDQDTAVASRAFTLDAAGGLIAISGSEVNLLNFTSVTTTGLGRGDAGNIDIAAKNITVDSSRVESNSERGFTEGTGGAGTINLRADDLTISSGAGISTTSAATNASAAPGSIVLLGANNLSVSDSLVTADTIGAANAGDVDLIGGAIDISSASVFAESFLNATGDAGSIVVDGTALNVANNSVIASRALTESANAGAILLTAPVMTISTGSEVSTTTFGAGNAGDVVVLGEQVQVLSQAVLSSESLLESIEAGDSGNLVLLVDDLLFMNQGALSTNSLFGQGGNISVSTVNSEVMLIDSVIRASAGEDGNGGNVFLETEFLTLEESNILAEAEAGNGGFINIDGKVVGTAPNGDLLRSRITVLQDFTSEISADSDSGTAGTVNIEAPSNDISAVISDQNANVLVTPTLAMNPCDEAGDQSRLTSKPPGEVRTIPEAHLSVGFSEPTNEKFEGAMVMVTGCKNDASGNGGETDD